MVQDMLLWNETRKKGAHLAAENLLDALRPLYLRRGPGQGAQVTGDCGRTCAETKVPQARLTTEATRVTPGDNHPGHGS